MRDTPDLVHGIYRVTHSILVGDKRFIANSDLVFLDDVPYIVLEWGGPEENQYPEEKVAIDDLSSLMLKNLKFAVGDMFHWKTEGRELLVKAVTESITQALRP